MSLATIWQRVFITLLSLTLGLALCVFLFLHVNINADDWMATAHSLSLMGCIGVFALSALLMLSGSRKWAILSRALHGPSGEEPSPGFFLRHYLWQNWIGQFVPPSLAIVLGRGWAARAMPEVKVRSGLWNGLLDQALDFALLISFAPGCIWVLFFGGGWLAFFAGAAAGVGALALCVWGIRRWWPRLMSRLLPCVMPDGVRQALWPLFGWSFVRAALTVLRFVVGIGALGLFLSEIKVASIAPLVSVLALVPLTPGNLGIAEWGWQGMLVFACEGAVTAALYAAAFRILIVVVQTVLLGLGEIFFSQARFKS